MWYVEIEASTRSGCGKMVWKPSYAALPGLSVTPGLKPMVITASGVVGKCSLDVKKSSSVSASSIIGSAKRSFTRLAMSAFSVFDLIKNPLIERTSPTSMLWSALSCRRMTSPRTSRIPSPCFGVTSTRVTAMEVHPPPTGA